MRHDTKAFDKRSSVITCSHAFVKVVGQYKMSIDNPYATTLCTTYDTNAPIEVCGEAVAEVVLFLLGEVGADIERLVADAHPVAECVGRELLRRREAAAAKEVPLIVNQICVAIEDGCVSVLTFHPSRHL